MKATDFIKMKQDHQRITMVTAYNYPMAKMAEDSGIDCILVGDSLGMVMLGYDSTIPVTMEDMLVHVKAVTRGAKNTFVVADMPFMSYQLSEEQALQNAARMIQEGGANCVKLEGGQEVAKVTKRIVDCGIPVIGHIGMTPQSVNAFGGFKAQGKDVDRATQLIDDAIALEQAGCCAIVLELMPQELAEIITNQITIPTIGIGSGVNCDGQVQVMPDMLGFTNGFMPKHAKKYANFYETGVESIKSYIEEVKTDAFPTETTCPHIEKETANIIRKYRM